MAFNITEEQLQLLITAITANRQQTAKTFVTCTGEFHGHQDRGMVMIFLTTGTTESPNSSSNTWELIGQRATNFSVSGTEESPPGGGHTCVDRNPAVRLSLRTIIGPDTLNRSADPGDQLQSCRRKNPHGSDAGQGVGGPEDRQQAVHRQKSQPTQECQKKCASVQT